jgi:hypothetical protein
MEPPRAPSLKGSTIDLQVRALAQSPDPLGREAMLHGRDE